MTAMLGEQGTEQFAVAIWRDEELISEQKVHDPFVRSTVVVRISRWDLFRAMFLRQYETRIQVRVDATEGAQQVIMTLDPEFLERKTQEILEQRRISRETSPTIGYYVETKA